MQHRKHSAKTLQHSGQNYWLAILRPQHKQAILLLLFIIFSLVIVKPVNAATTKELVDNGTFSSDMAGWLCDGTCSVDNDQAIDGNFVALGGVLNESALLAQAISIPKYSSNIIFSVDYRFFTADYEDTDYLVIAVQDRETSEYYTFTTIYAGDGNVSDWSSVNIQLPSSASGQSVAIFAMVVNDSSLSTFADIDTMSLTATVDKRIEAIGTLEIKKHKASVYWIPSEEAGTVRFQLYKRGKNGTFKKVRSHKFEASSLGTQVLKLKSKTYYKFRVKFIDSSVWSDWGLFKTN